MAKWTRVEHDAKAAKQDPDKKIAGHTQDELAEMVRKGQSLPGGVSFSPHSKVPFVSVTPKEQEALATPPAPPSDAETTTTEGDQDDDGK